MRSETPGCGFGHGERILVEATYGLRTGFRASAPSRCNCFALDSIARDVDGIAGDADHDAKLLFQIGVAIQAIFVKTQEAAGLLIADLAFP